MGPIDAVKLRLHRDIVADPVLHGLVLNLYLNGEQYPHRVADYFPLAAADDPALADTMRAHMADEDKHIALYSRAIGTLGQPLLDLPLDDVFNEVIRRHTPVAFAMDAADGPSDRTLKLAHFFAHLHFLEMRVARSLEYHVEACERAASSYPQKVVAAVLRDELRHAAYTRETVLGLLPRGPAQEVLALHRRAEQRANLDFSSRQLGRLLREQSGRFPRLRGAGYRACVRALRGVLALA